MKKIFYDLKTDPEIKSLTFPISSYAYSQLEESLVNNGCENSIVIWNGYILDGHKRYKICCDYGVPFAVKNTDFVCHEVAIAWVCANQLHNNHDLPEETRKYLIGKEHDAIMRLNPAQRKLQSKSSSFAIPYSNNQDHTPTSTECRNLTAAWVAADNNVSRATVQKYALYAKAIDSIAQKVPDVVPKILSGQYKISHNNIVELSKMSPEGICKVSRRIEALQNDPFVQYKNTRAEIRKDTTEPRTSVKDMPAFDPDSEVIGLTLTIPSWSSSIERVRTKSDLTIISPHARQGLINALQKLINSVDDMLSVIKED